MAASAEPTFDADGYPTEATLRVIRKWNIKTFADCTALLDYIEKAWYMREWGWGKAKRRSREWGFKHFPLSRVYHISTAGWSGNESLIGAMEKNWMFWAMTWQQSRRGGHYIFRVTEE